MSYYDNLVNGCNSSYKEVMKTIAFAVSMGQMLSHVGSASVRTSVDNGGQIRCKNL